MNEPTTNEAQVAATQMMSVYSDAAWARDVETLMGLYDPAVRVFDMWSVWSYQGVAAWREAVNGWLTSLGDERVRVSFEDVETCGDGGLLIVSAIVTYASISAKDEVLRTMQNRISWGVKKTAQGYRIVHEHTSAPIAFDGCKAILNK